MLIRRLTLAAFASLVTAASSTALVANAAQHATPALADQDDYGYYQPRHDRDDRRRDDGRRDWSDGRYGGESRYGRGYQGDDRRDRRHDRDDDRDRHRHDDREPHG
ncbi:MAG TPA: hypothetical protein VMA36_00625 [Candidatus Limnocylindria bacterium]|jgi:hypothetical protein|nr:hypothetical protein [Candidatus Limnocylindria bacterium]